MQRKEIETEIDSRYLCGIDLSLDNVEDGDVAALLGAG